MTKYSSVLLGLLIGASSLVANSGGLAPINPAFSEWQKKQSDVKENRSKINRGIVNQTGWVPTPELKPEKYIAPVGGVVKSGSASNAKFDLRDPDLNGVYNDSTLTPMRNQGACGSCWAFAAYGSLEGQIKGLSTVDIDLSENNLKHNSGFSLGPCDGGNMSMTIAYLSRVDGPVLEADDPYIDNSTGANNSAEANRYIESIKLLPARTSTSDIDYMKQALVDKGPLYVSMAVNGGTAGENSGGVTYDEATFSFYAPEPVYPNHGVVVVGWDDNYQAQGQVGAFIVRNSWGMNWGEDGYFYVPYTDQSLAFFDWIGYFEDAPEHIKFNKIYDYTPLGAMTGYGYDGGTTFMANKFTTGSDKNEKLNAIGLHAVGTGYTYEIKIFDTVGQEDGKTTFSNQIGDTKIVTDLPAGWATIELETPVSLPKNSNFIVQVKIVNPKNDNKYVAPVEMPFQGYSDSASASTGQSYASYDGAKWDDLTTVVANANFVIKAFVEDEDFSADWVVDGAPVADIQTVYTKQDIQQFPIVLKATDPENANLTYEIKKQVESGAIILNGDTVLYTPNNGFIGMDTFTFVAKDPAGNISNEAIITIQIKDANFPILDMQILGANFVTNNDVNFTAELKDTTATISNFEWDFGDGTPINTTEINPAHKYINAGDYTVSLKVIDSNGVEVIGQLPIHISENNIPMANLVTTINVLSGQSVKEPYSVTDADGHDVTVTVGGMSPSQGSVTIDETLNTFTYQSNNGYTGMDYFNLKFDDMHGGFIELPVQVNVTMGLIIPAGWSLGSLTFDQMLDMNSFDYQDYFKEQTIWRFKGNNWELADTGIKTDMMKFNNLEPYTGYWFKMEEDTNIPIITTPPMLNDCVSMMNIPMMPKGWQLLGSCNISDMRAFMSDPSHSDIINIWASTNNMWSLITNDVNDDTAIQSSSNMELLTELKPNQGFWIYKQ